MGKKIRDVRCRQDSGTIDGGHGHVGGLLEKQRHVVGSTNHNRVDLSCDVPELAINRSIRWCIIESECQVTHVVCKRRKSQVEASQDHSNGRGVLAFDDWVGEHCNSGGEEDRGDHEAMHYSRKSEGGVYWSEAFRIR